MVLGYSVSLDSEPLFITKMLCRGLDIRVAQAVTAALQAYSLKTITSDRGSESLYHEQITQGLGGIQLYFALPHHPSAAIEHQDKTLRKQ